MNGLSWIIYGSEVFEAIKVWSGVGLVGGGVAAFGSFLFSFMIEDAFSWETTEQKESKKGMAKAMRRFSLKTFPRLAIVFAFLLVIIPSKQTILLIGASQAGEQILQLQEVQEIGGEAGALASDTIKLLRQMVSDQLEGIE